jgi:hypothetical protein
LYCYLNGIRSSRKLEKEWKFVVKKSKTLTQVVAVEQAKVNTFLKTYLYELKRAFLSLSIFDRLCFKQKNLL